VTSNTPAVNLPTSGTTSVSNIQINDPTTVTGVNQPVSVGTTSVVDTQGVAGTVDPTISQGGATIPNAQVGVVYPTQTFTVTPGTGSTTITSLVASTLPGGLSFTAATNKLTGTITGTPTVSGAFTFTVTATDGATTAGTAVATVTGFVVAPNKITLTIGGAGSVGDTWGATAPTMSVVGANAVLSSSSTVLTLTFTAGTMQNALLTLSGLSVVTTSGTSVPGAQMVDVALVGGATSTALATVSVGTILGTATTIYGANGTADGTVAAEFENAYPANSGNTASGNRNVVLATDVAGTNGSDALAASYLEGTLGTGLLITPATTLGADAKLAMQLEGVTTVYVVGGPLAISPAVIAQIKALPAYNAGGLTQTGSNINVVGPIYGADGTAAGTAAAIATYYGTAIGAATFPSAYSNTGIGSYNTTTGVGTTTAPSGIVPTAIVVASSDWQDALSIAPEAFAKRFPIILTGPSSSTTLSATASATLTSLGVKQVIIAGGQLALQNSVEAQIAALNGGISVLRIAGIDNTDTAAQIANFAWGTGGVSGLGWTAASGHDSVMVSHGDYWTDALGAAALGGGANQATYGYEPILLTQTPTVIGQYTTAELAKVPSGVVNLTVLGGPLAMPASTVQTLLLGL
jgi:putative cell wall-binding protein